MYVVGQAVEGSRDWIEEGALLFAEAAQGEARKIVRARAVDAQLVELGARVAAEQASFERAGAVWAGADGRLRAAQGAPTAIWEKQFAVLVVAGAALGGVVALAVHPMGLLLGLGAALIVIVLREGARSERAKGIAAIQQEIAAAGAALAPTEAAMRALHSQREALANERATLEPKHVVHAVGRIYVPVVALEVAGYLVLVDESGATQATELRLPDLAADADVLVRIRRTIDEASRLPVLLRPSGDEHSAVETTHGEERDLGEAVEAFGDMLGGVQVLSAALPLVERDAPLALALSTPARQDDAPGAMLRWNAAAVRKAVANVTSYAARMRGVGKDAETTLRSLRDDLRGTIVRYGELRAAAIDDAHASLHEVLADSDLAYVTYYCPRCNRIPQYLFQRLGVDLDRAHELPGRDLLNALQEDDEAARRLVADETLVGELDQIYTSLDEVQLAIADFDRARANDLSVGTAQATVSRSRALVAQRDQLIAQFRAVLRKIVTGSARPLLELSRQARLYLDPATGHWDCPLCELHVEDEAVAKLGRLLKIKDDLLMPMWNQLWTEKDDFRKAELFRTNEQVQRLVEKETGALRDVSEQYRADMRPVRENLIIATTEAVHKRDQLGAAVNSLSALGVLSAESAQATIGRLGAMTGGDLDSMRKRAEAKETLLNHEPQAQMNRRVMAIDPVQVLMGPEALFREQSEAETQVRLPELPEHG